jgi:hypothetical protein
VIYELVNGTYEYLQILEGNIVPNFTIGFSSSNPQFNYCPVQFSADGSIIVWGWSTGIAPDPLLLGELYVFFMDEDQSNQYEWSQTITEPAHLPSWRYFASDAVLSATGQQLLVAAWTYNQTFAPSVNLTNRLYAFELADEGSAWPPVYQLTGYLSHPFCNGSTTCTNFGDLWGASISADPTLSTVVVGAPAAHYTGYNHKIGAAYEYRPSSYYANGTVIYSQAQSILNPVATATNNGSSFGYSVRVSNDGTNFAVGMFQWNNFLDGVGFSYGLPFGAYTYKELNNTAYFTTNPGAAPGQGASIAAQGAVTAVGTPYYNHTLGAVFLWDRNASNLFNLAQTLTPFGGIPANNNTIMNLGQFSTVLSADGTLAISGAPGQVYGTTNGQLLGSPGYAFTWRTQATPGTQGTACNLNMSSLPTTLPDEILCFSNATYDVFNLTAYYAANPTKNPCYNATSGHGAIYSYASMPPGLVTQSGLLYADSNCAIPRFRASLWVTCTNASSWQCGVAPNVNITRETGTSGLPVIPTTNNAFSVLGISETPPGLLPPTSNGLSPGAISGIVLGSIFVAVIIIFGIILATAGTGASSGVGAMAGIAFGSTSGSYQKIGTSRDPTQALNRTAADRRRMNNTLFGQ